ncbi:MAG: efflux transporter periplasmic adaptor subunit [Phycisphaerae bacterium]|nr:efflux transporter periplasmic adaptor subunit [Phycisphaerae bacterium]
MSKNRIYMIIGLAVIILAAILFSGQILRSKNSTDSDGPTYEVKHGPLTISFVESGTIKARDQIILKNEVEGRTSITYIIPEGTHVKKGDTLIELDVSTLEDQKIDKEITVQNGEAAFIGAKESLAVVENQAKSDVDLATLTLDFARQDLDKYIKGEHPYELDKANADITLAEEELTRAKETLRWSKQLYGEKYISQTELQADEIAEKKKTLDTELAKKSKDLLSDYTYKRNLAKLQSDVNQAEMAMERTKRKANADVIQAQAELKAKESEFGRQKDKLAKVEDQIGKTKIYAPADGLVIYATSAKSGHDAREPLDIGSEVQEREELIYLPTGNSSKAEVMVHESHLKKVTKELPTIITVDALQGKTFYGTVESIAPLPDARSMWMNPDLKVYTTEVFIDGNDPTLRTGMSCQAEVIVKQYQDAFYVPLQAVIKIGDEFNVYAKAGKSFQPRKVKIGLDNNKVIHIIEGLKDGDIVLLNPPFKSTTGDSQNRNLSEQNSENNKDGMQEKIDNGLKNMETNRISAAEPNQQTNIKLPDTKKQFENLTPEQREEMKKKFEQMTPEEREKARQKSGGRNRQQGSKKRDPNEQKQ